MKICFTSYRPFPDGPVRQPFQESDPANIAYVLGGDYLSFYTLKGLTPQRLRQKLQPYDLVFVALDIEAIELVQQIIEVCKGRIVTYSENHVGDYQRLPPAGQVAFLKAINTATINFLYWERYIPFYRALTSAPVEFLPYPYLLDSVRPQSMPLSGRPWRAALPSGLAGNTRNGLATLAVAKELLNTGLITELACWLEPNTFVQDAQAIAHFLFATPFTPPQRAGNFDWRGWLLTNRIDYRSLLKLKDRLRRQPLVTAPVSSTLTIRGVTLYRRHNWPNYVAQLAPARVLIDLNNRETVGRNALDCAALEIACVSTNRSDMQARLFPDTTLGDSWDIAGAVTLCERLLKDVAFYQRVVSYAAEAVQEFAPAPFRRRFERIIVDHLPTPPQVDSRC